MTEAEITTVRVRTPRLRRPPARGCLPRNGRSASSAPGRDCHRNPAELDRRRQIVGLDLRPRPVLIPLALHDQRRSGHLLKMNGDRRCRVLRRVERVADADHASGLNRVGDIAGDPPAHAATAKEELRGRHALLRELLDDLNPGGGEDVFRIGWPWSTALSRRAAHVGEIEPRDPDPPLGNQLRQRRRVRMSRRRARAMRQHQGRRRRRRRAGSRSAGSPSRKPMQMSAQ